MTRMRTGYQIGWILRAILGIGVWYALTQNHWIAAGILLMSLGASGLVYSICRHYLGETGQWMDVLFGLLIVFNNLFGMVLDFYHTVPGWDVATHYTTSAFLAVGALVLMQKAYPVVLLESPKIIIMMAMVLFSLGLGAAWEIMEYAADILFNASTQNGLANTMQDLVVDGIAGIVVGTAWVQTRKK